MKDFIYEGPVRIIYGAGQYKELKENPHDRKKLMEITTAGTVSGRFILDISFST